MNYPTYDYADRVIRYLARKNIDAFEGLIISSDIKKTLKRCDELLELLIVFAESAYMRLAKHEGAKVDRKWLREILAEPHPTTKFAFYSEAERKVARLKEALMVTNNPEADKQLSLKDWTKMINQYAIVVSDAALLKADKDAGARYAMWISQRDSRCCSTCRERDKNIFPIDKVPDKPHPNCRCRIVGIRDREVAKTQRTEKS